MFLKLRLSRAIKIRTLAIQSLLNINKNKMEEYIKKERKLDIDGT